MYYQLLGFNIPVYSVIVAIIGISLLWLLWRASRFAIGSDPVYSCSFYKKEGCSHVDGPFCDFPMCEILVEYESSLFDLKEDILEVLRENINKAPFTSYEVTMLLYPELNNTFIMAEHHSNVKLALESLAFNTLINKVQIENGNTRLVLKYSSKD